MNDWFDQLPSRANALRTDEELRAEFDRLADPGPQHRDQKARLEKFLDERRAVKRQRTADHKKAPYDAQKDKFRERD